MSHKKTKESREKPAEKVDPVTGQQPHPDGPGMYIHWEGRKSYRTRMPAPRVLEPVASLSFGKSSSNRVIEGDNLQAMVSLRSQYRRSIDIAYLDPPYNTGRRDFRYSDKRFSDPNAAPDDAEYVSNEDGGRHTKWLNFMGPRLWLVHELLADHGVCFVSINDIELFQLGMLMDEIFDAKNRLGVLVWKGSIENNPTHIAIEHEYVLCYAKRAELVTRIWQGYSEAKQWLTETFEELSKSHQGDLASLETAFQEAIKAHEATRQKEMDRDGESELVDLGRASRYKYVDAKGVYAAGDDTHKPSGGYFYDVFHPVTKRPCKPPASGYRFTEETMRRLLAEDRIVFRKDHTKQLQVKKYLSEVSEPLRSVIEIPAKLGTVTLKKLLGENAKSKFPHSKPVELIERLIAATGNTDALVLDPFAGSGTTAHAVLRLNARDGGMRRFILIEEGNKEDAYCRTLTAPRITAAIKSEKLHGGFSFERTGKRLNKAAILELEREALANLILQTDSTGLGRGLTRVAGTYVIGSNSRNEAICLYWNGKSGSTVNSSILRDMYKEAAALKLNRPLRVYGSVCEVGETESFRFCQIPDELLLALQLDDEDSDRSTSDLLEGLETAAQGMLSVRS
ncbi:site-specific DNA-methyltransferase [Cystobacter fuscus]|uniref:site-specific DNA-methyltransferase n=1 Tax=Cystobacter fuscus TaxID=43 RepID=UPI0037C06211